MTYCTNCGADSPGKFCAQCGTALTATASPGPQQSRAQKTQQVGKNMQKAGCAITLFVLALGVLVVIVVALVAAVA